MEDVNKKFEEWTDGTLLDYFRFDFTRLQDADEHCIKMSVQNSLMWEDEDCEQALPYVCKISKGSGRMEIS